MSREEAAALAVAQIETGDDGVTVAEDIDRTFARTVLAAADAHDRANGIHRIALDDATVERAARAMNSQFTLQWEKLPEWVREDERRLVRSYLAAAVKEEQACDCPDAEQQREFQAKLDELEAKVAAVKDAPWYDVSDALRADRAAREETVRRVSASMAEGIAGVLWAHDAPHVSGDYWYCKCGYNHGDVGSVVAITGHQAAHQAEVLAANGYGKLGPTKFVLSEREAELLKLKGPCSNKDCPLHYAHNGPCNRRRPE